MSSERKLKDSLANLRKTVDKLNAALLIPNDRGVKSNLIHQGKP